jgi:hypothetical protein
LGTDVRAIEPYPERSKRLLLLNQAGVNIDLEQRQDLEEQTETSAYFVYQLMRLDPPLPNLVGSGIPHTNGKANNLGNERLRLFRLICVEAGFWMCAFSGDGNYAYREFIKPIFEVI